MYMKPHPQPHHAIINLEGGDDEVLHVRALGKDTGIEIRVDEAKTGVVIVTRDGLYRQTIRRDGRRADGKEAAERYFEAQEGTNG